MARAKLLETLTGPDGSKRYRVQGEGGEVREVGAVRLVRDDTPGVEVEALRQEVAGLRADLAAVAKSLAAQPAQTVMRFDGATLPVTIPPLPPPVVDMAPFAAAFLEGFRALVEVVREIKPTFVVPAAERLVIPAPVVYAQPGKLEVTTRVEGLRVEAILPPRPAREIVTTNSDGTTSKTKITGG